jgi:hypothetical protein
LKEILKKKDLELKEKEESLLEVSKKIEKLDELEIFVKE